MPRAAAARRVLQPIGRGAPGAAKVRSVTEVVSTLDASDGELLLHTGVAGRAAKMGHRLTVTMQSWRAAVTWSGGAPVAVRVSVEVDSFQVLRGAGGLTPLSAPEKMLVRSNALNCLNARRHPRVHFQTTGVTVAGSGYRLDGLLDIGGQTHPHVVDVRVDGRRLHAQSAVRQTEFGIKPFSMLMGSMKVADEVTVSLTASIEPESAGTGQ